MTKRMNLRAGLLMAVAIAAGACSSGTGAAATSSTAAATPAAGGSSSAPAASAASGKSIKDCSITLIPKTTDNPYFTGVEFGANAAADELGGKHVDFVGSPQSDVPGQIQRVQAATVSKACAIAIASLDPAALAPALKTAKDAGVMVVGYDADTQPDARTVFVNQVDAEALGVAMAQDLAKQMNNTGDYAILSAQSTAANQNAWIAAATKELSKPAYSGMHLVKTVFGDDDYKKSYDQAVSLMQAYPNLSGILAPEPAGLEGATKARDDLKFNPKLAIAGLGWPPADAELLKNGKSTGFFLWSPNDLGYMTEQAINALITGQITGKEGESFQAGRLGKATVGANGVITVGPPVFYTKDNVDSLLSGYQTTK